MTLREQTENTEVSILSEYACKSTDKKMTKRTRTEEKCPYRTDFQRDRDRILHCKAFRRLKRKTQVFLSPKSDHYRTRLTHTLEVSQIARTISRCMRMNEDLTEAIALGHDFGHSPFGHFGETVLNEICPYGFRHYLQSVRVAEIIEKDGSGLNLTFAVKNGIACHTNRISSTGEGNIVRLADTIAYINHDIEDAVCAEILNESDLPSDCVEILGKSKSERITSLIFSVIRHGHENIDFEPSVRQAHDKLKNFMFEKVYTGSSAKQENQKAEMLIKKLYSYFRENTDRLPEEYRRIMHRTDADRAVCDYISGMSDKYAVDIYTEIFIPKFSK
ncbi:MAG: deoxyguanosinetriphosphate triphosphohydrolase [Ruminococcus sp.]|nr:deoxyguanosinetriphosphate triphosphohydrolase [Ruminococcus sp.]MDE6848729.1 deoxyguanosinetriphosphate triphosphohydrolase [Ruminococcus sp.]